VKRHKDTLAPVFLLGEVAIAPSSPQDRRHYSKHSNEFRLEAAAQHGQSSVTTTAIDAQAIIRVPVLLLSAYTQNYSSFAFL